MRPGIKLTAIAGIITISVFNLCSYAQTSAPDYTYDLMPTEKSAIDSLSDGREGIPAWVIAQLLDASDRLGNNSTTTLIKPHLVTINQILADSAGFRGRLCVIKSIFASAQNVDADVSLPDQDHCWTVFGFDGEYRMPLQLFTSIQPVGFAKGERIYVIGYYLANRTDRLRLSDTSQPVTVPMFMGIIRSAADSLPQRRGFPIRYFLAVILFLTASYLALRIYITRSGRKRQAKTFLPSRTARRWKR